MNADESFECVKPGCEPEFAASERVWVFLLRQWSRDWDELLERIGDALKEETGLATVIVLDNVEMDPQREHQRGLQQLADAGAIVVQARDEREFRLLCDDPFRFVGKQLAQAAQATPVATRPSDSIEADGYKQFGTAFTRLSDKDLEKLLAGPRTN